MKPQQRVRLRFSSKDRPLCGVVSRVYRDGSFTVTYDDPERGRGQSRSRFTYRADQGEAFLTGAAARVAAQNLTS